MLTEEERAKYIADPSRCPYCDGGDITGDSIEPYDSNRASRTITCENCGMLWNELFTVTAIDEFAERA